MKKRVYIAGPLFCQAELDFNLRVNDYLEKLGFETFLPQRDGHLLADLIINNEPKYDAIKKIFDLDVEEIRKSDILIFIMDGRVPDEGACVELGIAFSLNKECIGLKTDSRYLMDSLDNPLILGCVKGKVSKSISQLEKFLQ
jgi:nucleoside 2-deoxyribosyltransferase